MNEKELEQLLAQQAPATPPPAQEMQFQKRVRRAMNRTLCTRVAAVVLALAVLVCGLYFGVSQAMNLVFYDPGREPAFLEPDERQGTEFNLLLEDTIAMLFPGKTCLVQGSCEPEGFGRYGVDLQMTDVFAPRYFNGVTTDHFRIVRSQLDTGNSMLPVFGMEFWDPSFPYTVEPEESNVLTPLAPVETELRQLPPTSYLDVSISFAESLSAEEVAALIAAYPEVDFRWLALEGQNLTLYQQASGGMFLQHMTKEAFTEEALAAYPDYYLPQTITGESLQNCLTSRLQLLLDHPDFVALLETRLGDLISLPILQQRLANAQEHWACYGARLHARPADILSLMEQLQATQVRIHDVKLSRYQR